MPQHFQELIQLETDSFGGINSALQFSQIPKEQSPSLQNAVMRKVGSISKRDGTIPVTSSPLAASIGHLATFQQDPNTELVVASSGTTLYKYDGVGALVAQIMTNALNTDGIYTIPFTDVNGNSVLFITDGTNAKQYDGTTVKNVVAAANDTSPAPANDMTNINTKLPVYCWVHSSHVFMSNGKDICWYSKRFTFDYWPQTHYQRWVRENDYITGPGITLHEVCMIPMRKGWGILTGSTDQDFDGNQFMNTVYGCVAARSIKRISYPDGTQTIAYLSDNGVHEIFDTGTYNYHLNIKRYETRFLMENKVDFIALGLSDTEKKNAVAYFDKSRYLYILCFKRGSDNLAYAYDIRNKEWYPWTNIKANGLTKTLDGTLYYAGLEGHLRKFDPNLYSDWNDKNKTVGTPVYFKRYSPALHFEFSGYQSFWDYYLLEAKQWNVPSSIDISVIFTQSMVQLASAYQNNIFVWGAAQWGVAKWANANYTDLVNEPKELIFHKKAKYAQVLIENNRDEPVEIYKEKWKGRASGR